MQTKYIINSLLAFAFVNQVAVAQDIHFSQYSETPSAINPALAGVTYNTRVIANFKNQWSTVASKYQTLGLSFDQTIKNKKFKSSYFAVAFNIFKDVAGDAKLSTTNPNFGVSYIQRISKKMKFSGGLQSGFFYRTLDAGNLRYGRGCKYDESGIQSYFLVPVFLYNNVLTKTPML